MLRLKDDVWVFFWGKSEDASDGEVIYEPGPMTGSLHQHHHHTIHGSFQKLHDHSLFAAGLWQGLSISLDV